MKSVVAEGVEVVFGNLIINMLQLGLFVSPVLVCSAYLQLLAGDIAVLKGGLSLCEILLRGLRVVDGGRKHRGAACVRQSTRCWTLACRGCGGHYLGGCCIFTQTWLPET